MLKIWLAFLLPCLFWGGSYTAIKVVVTEIPPIFGATARVGISLLALALFYSLLKKPLRVPKKHRLRVWVAGLFLQGFPFLVLYWGERFITPGLTGILGCTTPLWTFVLSIFFLKQEERITLAKVVGVLVAFGGIFTIFSPQLGIQGNWQELLGGLAILLMAFCYGVGTIMNRRMLTGTHNFNSYALVFEQHISSFIFLCVATLMMEGNPPLKALFSSAPALVGTLYLSIFSTAISWLFLFYLLKHIGAIRTSSTTYVVPLVAILADYLYYGNVPTSLTIAGMFLILIGVVLIQGVTFQKIRRWRLGWSP